MVAVCIGILAFRWALLKLAYRVGVVLVTKLQHKLNALTNAATLLGVFVVGALVATMVNTKITYVAQLGDLSVNIQDKLDLILPRLVPLTLVGIIYWLLGKKSMNSTRVIFIVIIGSIILSALGIIGKM